MASIMNAEKSTYGTHLGIINEAGEFETLTEIIDYPDLEGTPSTIEITTLSDTSQRFVPGVKEQDTYEFTCPYTVECKAKLDALKGQNLRFGIWLGVGLDGEPSGNYGKFEFNGVAYSNLVGAGVNDARTLNISIVPSTEVEVILPDTE